MFANPINWIDPNGLSGINKKVPGTNASVRIDKPHVPGQQEHAHIKPKGKPEIVINKDETGSHGTDPNKIPKNKKLIDFLKRRGFQLILPLSLPGAVLEEYCRENPYDVHTCGFPEPEDCRI